MTASLDALAGVKFRKPGRPRKPRPPRGRPPLGERSMTQAERAKAYRDRKKAKAPE